MWMLPEQDALCTSPTEEPGHLANNAPLTFDVKLMYHASISTTLISLSPLLTSELRWRRLAKRIAQMYVQKPSDFVTCSRSPCCSKLCCWTKRANVHARRQRYAVFCGHADDDVRHVYDELSQEMRGDVCPIRFGPGQGIKQTLPMLSSAFRYFRRRAL